MTRCPAPTPTSTNNAEAILAGSVWTETPLLKPGGGRLSGVPSPRLFRFARHG
jgi:hypothetical protein